ncbi:hypothetical protein [Fibrobacter sp. UWH1]|uniref:OB-fold protein n=1 Tax=Fibrobacter sp. UWH1 TaxID=1964354 RepID=UPI000B525AAA|nr:hypothetical protein [Fibrobacter sp. UWH1]MCQ2099027.1 hypothetical protein [Fibrobacter sp.]OWV15387.1 hypothetical protein B7992_04885 [Fibrobacter sp. UWH1]
MRYCIRCARDIGEGHEYCPHCGTPQKSPLPRPVPAKKKAIWFKIAIIVGIVLVLIIAVCVSMAVTVYEDSKPNPDAIIHNANGSITTTAKTLLKEFNDNEIRAGEMFNEKRVSFSGCVESVNDMLLFSTVHINNCGILGSKTIKAIFPTSAKKDLATLVKGNKATITCTIVDGGNIMGVLAKECLVNH